MNGRHILRPRPNPELLATAVDDRLDDFRSRTMSAPTPLGAPILWPEIVRRVQLTSRSDTGTLPNAWTASEWNSTPGVGRGGGSQHRFASSATGSLFDFIVHATSHSTTRRRAPALVERSVFGLGPRLSPENDFVTAKMLDPCAAASAALCSVAEDCDANIHGGGQQFGIRRGRRMCPHHRVGCRGPPGRRRAAGSGDPAGRAAATSWSVVCSPSSLMRDQRLAGRARAAHLERVDSRD